MEHIFCPVCKRGVEAHHIVAAETVDQSVKPLLAVNAFGWEPGRNICRECLSRFQRVRSELDRAFPEFAKQELKILPTPMRLDAPDRWRGRDVTIAFIDAGFYAHPDLTEPRKRILKYVNIVAPTNAEDLFTPHVSAWHGMMTSTVAAGNGFMSYGLYRGIASEANLVLLKVGESSRIRHIDIERGLRWCIEHRERYNIRIINISCGGDYEESYLTDTLSQVAEEAARAGILVVAAAGNSGHLDYHPVLPPASAPSVLTVGGLDDRNNFDFDDNTMYRSSYGPTIDGLQKPEVIAPGIWIAAPILPGTPTAEQATLFSQLEHAADDQLSAIIKRHPGVDADLDQVVNLAPYLIRNIVWIKVRDHNVISGHYKHVDGTSFAAPIVSAIAAQLLEAAPHLKPHQVKSILIKTAVRLPNIEIDRQGWGMVNARAAIALALQYQAPATEAQPRLQDVASGEN